MNRFVHQRWWLSLILVNTLLFCVCGLPAALTDPVTHNIFYIIFYVAQNFVLAGFFGLLVWPLFRYGTSSRLTLSLAFLPEMLMLFFCYMNSKVFSFWRVHVNSAILSLYFSKGGGSQVFEISPFMYVWIGFSVLTFLLLAFLALIFSKRISHFFKFRYCFGFLAAVYFFAQISFLQMNMQNRMETVQYSLKIPYFYDFSWVHALQVLGLRIYPKHSLTSELKSGLSNNSQLHYPLHPLQYHLPKQPLNVLLIVVDTLRFDMINPVNMPNVFRFSEKSDRFLDNISGGDCTRPGIFSLFYGIPATYWHDALTHHQGSIVIRAFQDNGYRLGLYASAPLSSPPFDETVFATVNDLKIFTDGKTPLQRDEKITQEMQDFLNQTKQNHKPFFGFLFYDAPHAYNAITSDHPFHPIGYLNYFDVNNHTPVQPIFNLYKNAVFADDQMIEKVLSTLQSDHLDKNTVVIITADHGQEFNEYHNNYWEHASGFSKYQMRTPMIIAWPHREAAEYHQQTTHFDLAPTLLKRVLGVTNPVRDYSVGDDFFSAKQPDFVIAGNYAYYALVMPTEVMQFHDSGYYRFTDSRMKPMKNMQLNDTVAQQMLQQMTLYRP